MEIVGLIPAAGRAQRLGALPCSKEVFPVGFEETPDGRQPRPACAHLLEAFRDGGIRRAFVLLRQGKWDIPAVLGRGRRYGVDLAYLALEPTSGVPQTLDAAFPFVADATVALGFPDILFEPRDAYIQVLDRLERTSADVVLGLFRTDRPDKADMVETDDRGRARRLVIKRPGSELDHTWGVAAWRPTFSRFLRDAVARPSDGDELYVGDVLQLAIEAGHHVDSVVLPAGRCLDLGTPEDLVRAFRGGLSGAATLVTSGRRMDYS